MDIGCVLMASGFGARFGSNKLLALADGIPLIHRALKTYGQVPFARRVLVSQYEDILTLGPTYGFAPVYNDTAALGISASVRLGTASMAGMDGILFGVCDQPWLTAASVETLLAAFRSSPSEIYALSQGAKRGNPVIFPSSLASELLSLTGDTGGGQVIRSHPTLLRLVNALDPRELDDIDRPEDLS